MSESSIPLSKLVDVPNTFGACLIGALISAVLYGLTTLQTYLYYVYYPKDTRQLKILVGFIWIIDTVHFGFMSLAVYHYLVKSNLVNSSRHVFKSAQVTNYFNPAGLADGHWSLFASVALNSIVACVVQAFFVVRIFIICPQRAKWWVASFLSLLVLAHFAFGLETVTFMYIKKQLEKLSEISLFAATPFAIFAVLSDILIAGSLCYLLHENRTGIRKTDTLVSTLIIYAINRCLLTSVVAVVEVIVFCIMPHSLWFLAIDFFIGRLYANSLLATLNCRTSLMAGKGDTVSTFHLSDMRFTDSSSRGMSGKNDAVDHGLDLQPEGSGSQEVRTTTSIEDFKATRRSNNTSLV
ncbi:hypothetical protein CPC08DRAFT_765552 [Agrocybe pediades]|nr:hypothetical protein CPC08DRAFT_765552 [Agrocybe pediades]